MKLLKVILVSLAFSPVGAALAHTEKPHTEKGESRLATAQMAFGREGDPKRVTRTIRVEMSDTMRFYPQSIKVKRGAIVRFDVKNAGKTMHEMVLGTMKELQEHAELMRKNPGMEHDESYIAHVAPGETERMVWRFDTPGEFYYGCLIPGHFEAGMIGKIIVR